MSEEKETTQQEAYNYAEEPQQQYQQPQQPSYYPQNPYSYHPMYQARQTMPPMAMAQQFTGNQQPMMSQAQQLPQQQSYIENILRLNRGKMATVHMTFEGNNQRTFRGIIEAAGRDHIVLSEEETGRRVLLLMVYLDFVTFNEEINYEYPFDNTQQLATYPPRTY